MIEDELIMNRLMVGLKINVYEAKVLTVLMKENNLSMTVIADKSNVPRSRCYDIAKGLQKRRFIKIIPAHQEKIVHKTKGRIKTYEQHIPLKAIMFPLSEIVKTMKEQLNKELEERIEYLSIIKEVKHAINK